MTDITISGPAHTLAGYLRTPGGAGPWPGVVVLHDIVGQSDDSRRHVDWLAASGYLAVAPDLFSWGSKLRCIRATMRDLMARQGPAFADLEATRAFVAGHPECTGEVGVIGFCMGGGFALLAAAGGGFSASSVNYGQVPKEVEAILAGACPVVGSFGGRDFTLRGAAQRLDAALTANGVAHDVKEYPTVGHAFMNDHRGPFGWLVARIGMGYDSAVEADARRRILAFFGEHLH